MIVLSTEIRNNARNALYEIPYLALERTCFETNGRFVVGGKAAWSCA